MRPPRTVAVLAVGLLLVLSGCLGIGGPDRPPSDERAEQALADAQTAVAEVPSYRTRITGRIEARQEDERVSVRLNGRALTNASVRRMNASVEVDGDVGPGATGGPQRSYIDGYTAYSECRIAGWDRMNLSESRPWLAYTPVGQQLALLNRTDVYWRGTERIDGTEAAVVQALPTTEELRAGPDPRAGATGDLEDATVENVTVTLWLDTDTDRPVQARREIRLRDGGATATATVTFRFEGYGDPLRVPDPQIGEEDIREVGC